jgi:hypothetical protein
LITSLDRSRPGVGSNDARVADAEDHQQPFVDAQLLDDGIELFLKFTLELVGEILNFRLCILLGELHVPVGLLDVLFELRPRRVVQDGPTACSLSCIAFSAFCFARSSLFFFFLSSSSFCGCRFAFCRVAGNGLDVDERDFRPLRKWRRGLRRGGRRLRRRCGGWWRGGRLRGRFCPVACANPGAAASTVIAVITNMVFNTFIKVPLKKVSSFQLPASSCQFL